MTAVFSGGVVRRYVLDANALIGLLEARRGAAEKVRHLLSEALRQDAPLLMSAVNWGEVFYIAWRRHGEAKAREAEARLQEMPVAVIAADRERASRAGALKEKHGLGYADPMQWRTSVRILHAIGQLPHRPEPAMIYTNTFVAGSARR